MDFFPTTYPSNTHTVNSNQGLGVVKICVHLSFLKEKLDWFNRTLFENDKKNLKLLVCFWNLSNS